MTKIKVIDEKSQIYRNFNDLEQGDCFKFNIYDSAIFLKVDDEQYVGITTGYLGVLLKAARNHEVILVRDIEMKVML